MTLQCLPLEWIGSVLKGTVIALSHWWNIRSNCQKLIVCAVESLTIVFWCRQTLNIMQMIKIGTCQLCIMNSIEYLSLGGKIPSLHSYTLLPLIGKHDLGHWTLITFFHYFFCSWEALTWHYLALLLDDAAPYSCYEKFRRYLHAIDGVTVTQSEILFNTFTFISIARLKCWFKTNVKQLLHDL